VTPLGDHSRYDRRGAVVGGPALSPENPRSAEAGNASAMAQRDGDSWSEGDTGAAPPESPGAAQPSQPSQPPPEWALTPEPGKWAISLGREGSPR
jgi:hypothetical protein